MKYSIKNIFLLLFVFSFQSLSQEIDDSIISQLTPEQIEIASELSQEQLGLLEAGNVEDEVIDAENIVESLVESDLLPDSNIVDSKIKYGYNFFNMMPTSLSAVGDLPLPNDYKISIKDEFRVILTGAKDAIFDLDVELDGTILFPEIGSVTVAGLSFSDVKEKLATLINQTYIGVNLDISLRNLSAKKITIVGAVKTPGTYLVNPFATITGALAYSGGISEIGTLRDIKLIRNSGTVHSFDLYNLLIKGDRSKDITIEAGDTILINAASQFLEISGEVRRQGTYEILPGETIEDAIEFSLGFTEKANKSNISLSILDLDSSSIVIKTTADTNFDLTNVFSLNVFTYVTEELSEIEVIGAVEEPGFYSLDKYKNLESLINDLAFVDVYPWMAVVEQFDKENLIKKSTLFNLKDRETYRNIDLLPNTKIYFADIESQSFEVEANEQSQSLIDDYSLRINFKDDTFIMPVFGRFNVNDLINFLGFDTNDIDKIATYVSPLDNFVISDEFTNMSFIAKRYHNVSFRSPVNDLITVSVNGAVDYPGNYALKSNSTLGDLYRLLGNFKDEAFLGGIIFKRESVRQKQIQAIEKSQMELNEYILSMESTENTADINLIMALSEMIDEDNLGRISGNYSPESDTALSTILFDGDEIIIPKNPNIISVIGEVFSPISFKFNPKFSVQDAIQFSGGFKESADKSGIYVIKANGLVERSSRNIFSKNVQLEPGDTVVVPRKVLYDNPVTKALLPITSILSDLAFSAAAIESLSNN